MVDSSVNLVMSLVSHGSLYIQLVHLIFLLRLCVDMDDILVLCMIDCSLYIHLAYLIFLLRLCVDMDDILVLCMIDCCMTTHLLLDCMLLVYVGHTFIPLSPTP